jgi:hypothetical protein
VNVVFLLNTRGLGDVKVQLQVWKNDCQCKVSVSNEEASKFIQGEASELSEGFSNNTPFTLSKLDISAATDPLRRALDSSDDLPSRPDTGLNLTA